MMPSRRVRIVLRIVLYGGLLGCIPFFLTPVRYNHQMAKRKMCQIEMANFQAALKAYKLACGTFPSGDAVVFARSLRGQNPKGLVFLDVDLRSIDANGAFVDPWQTPYDIRMTSTNSFSIRSAGMNRRFGDRDDVVSPP